MSRASLPQAAVTPGPLFAPLCQLYTERLIREILGWAVSILEFGGGGLIFREDATIYIQGSKPA